MSRDRRVHERKPIRLKVAYKSASSLVTEYTKSVSKGGFRFETRKQLEVGTLFVFEMYAVGLPAPVEVEGVVVRTNQVSPESWEVGVQYQAVDGKRIALEKVLDKIFAEYQWDKSRKHARIPVNLPAKDGRDPHVAYLIRDISLGGMGLRIPGQQKAPEGLTVGTPMLASFLLENGEELEIGGEVVWVLSASKGLTEAGVGIQFERLTDNERKIVEVFTRLGRPQAIVLTFLSHR